MAEQHLIYHWKHGWIPLTHAAALSKAKGNAKLADKYVPGASSHHRDMPTAGLSARAIHGTLTPHERHHSDAAEVAKLRNGDHATVHGMDEHGQPMSFAGRVSGIPTAVRIKQGRNGKVEHHFAVSMHNGSEGSNGLDATARTTVYVKNPDQQAVAGARVRSLEPTATFSGVHSETHMGERITVKRAPGRWGYMQVEINGHPISQPIARTNGEAVRHLDATRRTIEDAKARPEAYTNGYGEPAYGMKLDKPASAVAEPQKSSDWRYEHIPSPTGEVHWVNAYHPHTGERVGDMTWHAKGDHHVTFVSVYDEKNRRKGVATGMWNHAQSVDPQVSHNNTSGGQTDAGRAWAASTSAEKPAADARRGRMDHAAPPTAVSALFDRSRMTPAQEREHVRKVQGQLDSARAARTTPTDDAASKTDAELEVMAKRSPMPAYREAAKAELDRRQSTSAGSTPDTSKRVQVDHSGDGTTLEIDRTDTQAREAVKAAGFRWSSSLGAWYLPRTYSEPTRRQKVEDVKRTLGEHNVHVNDGGRGATTTAAEREAATRAAAADRAERMDARAQRAATEADVRFGRAHAIGDMIPMGQPILVGHHSEGRHRRDLAKIDSNMRKGFEAQQESEAAARSAENARRTAAGDSPLARQRRIDRNEAELRKIDRQLTEHRIATKAPEKAARVGMHPLSSDSHEQLIARRSELADQVAHDKTQIEASGHTAVNVADVSQGDLVHYRGQWHIAKKVNKTTISVPTGYSWDDKIPVNQVTGHKKLVDLPESALKAGAANATLDPKLRASYVRELNRRGIHLGAS